MLFFFLLLFILINCQSFVFQYSLSFSLNFGIKFQHNCIERTRFPDENLHRRQVGGITSLSVFKNRLNGWKTVWVCPPVNMNLSQYPFYVFVACPTCCDSELPVYLFIAFAFRLFLITCSLHFWAVRTRGTMPMEFIISSFSCVPNENFRGESIMGSLRTFIPILVPLNDLYRHL